MPSLTSTFPPGNCRMALTIPKVCGDDASGALISRTAGVCATIALAGSATATVNRSLRM